MNEFSAGAIIAWILAGLFGLVPGFEVNLFIAAGCLFLIELVVGE